MTDKELNDYVKKHQDLFTRSKKILELGCEVNKMLKTNDFEFFERVYIIWLFEFLRFAIHTSAGRDLYIKLLDHVTLYCPISLKNIGISSTIRKSSKSDIEIKMYKYPHQNLHLHDMLPGEVWRPVPDFENYYGSSEECVGTCLESCTTYGF
jgi:hypothetical protein